MGLDMHGIHRSVDLIQLTYCTVVSEAVHDKVKFPGSIVNG